MKVGESVRFAPRASPTRRTKSSRVWPLSRIERTRSSTDSTAVVTKRHPVRARVSRWCACFNRCSTLIDVIGEVRELPMELFPQTDSVADAVKEIRIAESDVLGTTGYLLANVLDDHSTWNDAKPSAIDGDDRAVTAQVFTTTAGLCVAHRSTPPLAQ